MIFIFSWFLLMWNHRVLNVAKIYILLYRNLNITMLSIHRETIKKPYLMNKLIVLYDALHHKKHKMKFSLILHRILYYHIGDNTKNLII